MASASCPPPSPTISNSGLDLKNEGNAFFQKRCFAEALACYSKGIAALTRETSSNNADCHLEATLYSNRSGCYYEMGDYKNSVTDARKCAQLLMDSMSARTTAPQDVSQDTPPNTEKKSSTMVTKNLYRAARALHFDNAPIGEIEQALRLLEQQDESGEYSGLVEKMREGFGYDSSISTETKVFQPSLLRSSFQSPYVEYFTFGHDESESLLRRNEGNNAQSIILDELNEDELSSLAFLFGGVGDGRHAFATLLDAHHQYNSLSEEKKDMFRLHLTLNDICAQLLAKDALVIILSYELGKSADSVKTALTTIDPFNIGMVLYYATLGFAMPPSVYQKMVEFIKCWFTENTRESFNEEFPWLIMSQDTWDGIINIMKAWVDPEAHYSPHFPSAKEILSTYMPAGDDTIGEAMSELSLLGAGADLMGDMKSKLDSVKDQKRAQVAAAVKTMDLTDDMVKNAKMNLGEDATDEEMRQFLIDLVTDQMLDGGSCPLVSNMDKLFIEETKCLYPFCGSLVDTEESQFFVLKTSDNETGSTKKEALKAISKYKQRILESWVANPVKIDPSYHFYVNGVRAPDRTNPVKEFSQFFLTDEIISFMEEPPLMYSSSSSEEENQKAFRSNSLCSNLIRYYWHVGRAIGNLQGKTTIEIALCSIISFGDASSDRREKQLPNEYQRITLSNIPDYVGLHIVFITLAPLLASKSNSITPCIQSNTLMNTGLWKSYDDYVFSTTALGYKDAERIFGLKVASEEPSVWDKFVVWEKADDNEHDKNRPWSHDEFRTWINLLFLMTVLPSDRDVNSTLREERPSNVNLFLMTLSHCVKNLSVPAHFIASLLGDLLKKTSLVTKATLSNESPAPYLGSKNTCKKSYNLTAFHSELANQSAIFLQNSMFGFRLLDTSFLPTKRASLYKLKLLGINPQYAQSWAFTFGSVSAATTLGFMLQKKKSSNGGDYGIASAASNGNSNPMLMMMAMMKGNGMPESKTKPSKLRSALLTSGSHVGHIFSCMNWNLENQTASFWMCDDMFEKFRDFHFRLIRTDGWYCLPHGDVKLGDAKPIA